MKFYRIPIFNGEYPEEPSDRINEGDIIIGLGDQVEEYMSIEGVIDTLDGLGDLDFFENEKVIIKEIKLDSWEEAAKWYERRK